MRSRYRSCLVTGASSGIGRALALELGRGGVEVVLCARRVAELEEVAAEIHAAGGRARVQRLDVANLDESVAIIRRLDEELGGLELVIANAGVGLRSELDPHSWEATREACHVNFTGAIATLTAALPQMKARGGGHLVGISSLASFGSLPGSAAYCAPKAGLSMFLDCLRLDLDESGVAVTTVNVGFVRTAITEHALHPMPQLLDVDAAARTICLRLVDRPARIDFPQPLAWLTRIVGGLPRVMHDLIMRLVMRLVPGVER